jgi:preprotein translocase subunit YajC
MGEEKVGKEQKQENEEEDEQGGTVQAAGEQTVSAVGGLFGGAGIWVVYAVILVGMYFLLMRPQRKREKQMKEMQAGIRVGDNVVTNGGLYGRVADLGEDSFIVEFGTNRSIKIPVRKTDVLGVKEPKLTPPPKIE